MAAKRDSAYWRKRLEREHPAIFTRLESGAIASVRQACAEAGLIHLPTRQDALEREWKAATKDEKRAFILKIVPPSRATLPPSAPSAAKPPDPLVGADGLLTPPAVARIRHCMDRLKLDPGQVTEAMGFSKLDPRLFGALNRTWAPKPDFVEGLERFLAIFAD